MSTIPARVLLAIAQTVKKPEENTLQFVMRVLISVFVILLVLTAAITEILDFPEEFDGDLGTFKEEYGYIFKQASTGAGKASLSIDDAEIEAYIQTIADPQRRAIIETAASLVGKVPYFWGGKSSAGWNDEWNTQKLVTASGSSSSGTYRPYGLDCSGYVDWVYRTAGIGNMLSPSPYGGIRGPWRESYAITEDELLPGDLVVLYDPATTTKTNHIGIFYGRDANGKKLYLHSSSSGGGVVIDSYSGFKYWRRVPALYD